jgi:probable HAF family extracellular repeat protein
MPTTHEPEAEMSEHPTAQVSRGRHLSGLILLAVVTMAGGAAAQDEPLFITLPPGAIPSDVSGSGFTVVGLLLGGGSDPVFGDQGFYWMPTTGVVPIGGTQANAISRDGRTIAGRALDDRGQENAAIWLGGTQWQLLGSFSPDAGSCDRLLSGTFGMNDDGNIIVGLGWDGCRVAHGFRWEEGTGLVDLGTTVPGRSSRANAVSSDGRVIVGWQDDPFGFRQGAVWREGAQEVLIGPFGAVGEAMDVNSDGSIIVGQNCNPLDLSAWIWTPETGIECKPVERPDALKPYLAMMLATSEDGRVIGGAHSFGPDSEAVLWLDGEPLFIKDYLRANGVSDAFEGWINTGFITAVSIDGRVIVGQGAGPITFQGYIIVLPEQN